MFGDCWACHLPNCVRVICNTQMFSLWNCLAISALHGRIPLRIASALTHVFCAALGKTHASGVFSDGEPTSMSRHLPPPMRGANSSMICVGVDDDCLSNPCNFDPMRCQALDCDLWPNEGVNGTSMAHCSEVSREPQEMSGNSKFA